LFDLQITSGAPPAATPEGTFMASPRGRADRYELNKAADTGQRASLPPNAIRSGNVAIDTVAVPDPKPHPDRGPGQRLIATVNRRVDILEHERSHGRISNEAYLEGRLVQAIFERTGLSGGSTWNAGSRVDAEIAKELAIIRRVDTARAITVRVELLKNALGLVDAEIVRQILGENRKYVDVVLPQRMATAETPRERGVSYIAQRFRDALETLAQEQRRGRR
jgi:hypothetical protein